MDTATAMAAIMVMNNPTKRLFALGWLLLAVTRVHMGVHTGGSQKTMQSKVEFLMQLQRKNPPIFARIFLCA